MNLSESYNFYIEYLKKSGKSQSTLLAYGKDIEQLLSLLRDLGVKNVDEFQTGHVDAFILKLEKENYTPKSISRKLNSIKTFCRMLTTEGIISENPAKPVPHPKIETKEPRVLSEMEFRALRDAVRYDQRLYTIIELLLQTGIRIGELARLAVKDVNLKDATLFVRQYSSNPERMVPLNKTATTALKIHIENRMKSESDALFITKTGRCLLVRNIRSSINKAFNRAGIKNAKVNDLRNTFIAHNLARGANLSDVSQIVGHKRVSTTEKYLNLVDKKDQKESSVEEL